MLRARTAETTRDYGTTDEAITLRASRLLTQLQQLDEHHAQRQELIASGVAKATAEALYPFSPQEITERLLEHLRGVELDFSEVKGELFDIGWNLGTLSYGIPPEAGPEREQWLGWMTAENRTTPAAKALRAYLSEQAELHGGYSDLGAESVGAIWHVWVIANNREHFPQAMHPVIDSMTVWLCADFLHLSEGE